VRGREAGSGGEPEGAAGVAAGSAGVDSGAHADDLGAADDPSGSLSCRRPEADDGGGVPRCPPGAATRVGSGGGAGVQLSRAGWMGAEPEMDPSGSLPAAAVAESGPDPEVARCCRTAGSAPKPAPRFVSAPGPVSSCKAPESSPNRLVF
jgi:hypothetical protein